MNDVFMRDRIDHHRMMRMRSRLFFIQTIGKSNDSQIFNTVVYELAYGITASQY